MYQERHNFALEEARAHALAKLNTKLGSSCTRADLWRWEGGGGMTKERRGFIMNDVLPYIIERHFPAGPDGAGLKRKPTAKEIADLVDRLV